MRTEILPTHGARAHGLHTAPPSRRRPAKALAVLAATAGVCVSLGAVTVRAAEPPRFGIARFDGTVSNENGTPFAQAGGHPYQASTTIEFNSFLTNNHLGGESTFPNQDAKDIQVGLPPGFTVNPAATPKCKEAELEIVGPFNVLFNPTCPAATQVGVVKLTLSEAFGVVTLPVYNVVPPPGRPAQLAFNVLGQAVVHLFPSVRSGSDFGINADIVDTAQSVPFTSTTLTLWGVPADPRHDAQRGQNCVNVVGFEGESCFQGGVSAGLAPKALLSNPTSCVGPQTTTLATDSWQSPGAFETATFVSHDNATPSNPIGTDGCGRLPFAPAFSVQPTTHIAAAPTGLNVDIHVPQEGLENPEGLASADLKKAVVSLPAGMSVNPSAANGLAACATGQIGLIGTGFPAPNPIHFTAEAAKCPDSAKIGTVEVDTPLLEAPLKGSVYLAQQGSNPFNSLLAVYIVAEGQGIILKLPGLIQPDEHTGQLTATFDNNPQLPFDDLHVDFFGGSHAPLVTPSSCGNYTTTAQLTPWSTDVPTNVSSSFAISERCSAAQSFSPSFSAGTTSNQAGGSSPFTLSVSRTEQDQRLNAVNVQLPPGLLGVLKSVPLCAEPQASSGGCGAESDIGHTSVAAGAGPSPFWVEGGKVYLTGPYKGAPFGLSIVVPAIAGPFNLGTVVVRAAIKIDPHTAQVTVVSDPLPTILQGIPLDLRAVDVTVDRSGFMLNPTSCSPMAVGGAITSVQGATAAVSNRFQAVNCASLAFKPKLTALTQAKHSKSGGESLHVKVVSGAGQANIAKVRVLLPKLLPSRLTTLQKACTEATFNANPASCPSGSLVGSATAVTPVLAHPLTGPAYLVSHGGAAFPDLVVVLQGEGITLYLDGNTDIKKGITSSTFNSVPDAPISTFDLTLPQGPHSALAANGNLCKGALNMPTTITGQNGAQTTQTTRIAVSGCPKAKAKHNVNRSRKHKKK
jgi:hypothetical protein